MRALVTGATGFVGPRLLRLLNDPVVLTRSPERARDAIGTLTSRIYAWDPMQGPPTADAFDGVDTVFHLAGESVAEGRWSAAQKARIRDSRLIGTRHLVQGIAALDTRPTTLVCRPQLLATTAIAAMLSCQRPRRPPRTFLPVCVSTGRPRRWQQRRAACEL